MIKVGLAMLCVVTAGVAAANAEPVRILALGASNTNGRGVGTDSAWPAQLQRMLRAKGYDVIVTVNAVNGQTSGQILGRAAGGIEQGTKFVIFDNGGDNDLREGVPAVETNANVARIVATIKARGAIPIRAPYRAVAGQMYSSAGYQGDGHHLSAESHARVAAALVPQITRGLKPAR